MSEEKKKNMEYGKKIDMETWQKKQPITLDLVNVNKIVTSDKFKHNDKVLYILLALKIMILIHLYIMICLKWVDT